MSTYHTQKPQDVAWFQEQFSNLLLYFLGSSLRKIKLIFDLKAAPIPADWLLYLVDKNYSIKLDEELYE